MEKEEDPNKNADNPENQFGKPQEITENGQKDESLFSPRFRSAAAMAGWDEETLLIASLIVEDTPDHQIKHKKRSGLQNFRTPPSSSRRKRKARRGSPASIPVAVLNLDEDEPTAKEEKMKIRVEGNTSGEAEKKTIDEAKNVFSSSPVIPCIDRLREELSCAICLEICYEPSTTPCGHSFCKKCLRSASDKCGKKCPKCRQLISGRYCTVNTVLWNTIQLLFPQEVEARKAAAAASDSHEAQTETPAAIPRRQSTRNRSVQALNSPENEITEWERRNNHRLRSRSSRPSERSRGDFSVRAHLPSQDEDAALALRLQREEFMDAFRVPDERNRSSLVVARANLRAMASRAINIRIRDRT